MKTGYAVNINVNYWGWTEMRNKGGERENEQSRRGGGEEREPKEVGGGRGNRERGGAG